MAPTLLVLAAGMGSRYGGLKQTDPVGPSGETMLDYAVFDAVRAGFARVVFVVGRESEGAFRSSVASKYAGRIASGLVVQAVEDLPDGRVPPPGRIKPWGTGHAVWCARAAVTGPFAVANADDFYGASSYARLSGFLGRARGPSYAIVGFSLANTLSESGTVSRGVCRVEGDRLASIVEERAIARSDVGPGRRFSGTEIVSMNLWGFTPAVFEGLGAGLRAFLEERGRDAEAEFYLPVAVSDLVAAGRATVEVIASKDRWFGITYRGDRARAVAAIDDLVRRGSYPRRLFG
ncbi:MAG TPA: NTP transferase domain-containing protein [Candidatus Sulfotelmatobacter sp.]|nr:NTP transferase domain-containing protein [Candidatus Sulfotelmatobacter sp.]